ncbi:lipid A export permease/ATP-binding protein MsbA [Amantichitinum ursilacus]|uniref:Lipid A export ATP-binding/permease protein MsbA n=1 Tax=Amantichitinum ursilacus TaxID=857265 RepID=A0A0N0GMW4_9NEIS|nr:lipid A export permease/ATP-binding protein MsbA [Amantichitinum ursilacus]KPC52052.1 Lipid A export ATP-binding/permease protein MsbA [Amantichitinum ursilacus]
MNSSRALYFRLLREIQPYWPVVALSIFCLAAAAGVDVYLTSLLKPLVDQNLRADSLARSEAWDLPLEIFGLAVIRLVTNFGSDYGSAWISARVMYDLREKMFSRFLKLPVRYYDKSSTGVLVSRVTYDVSQIMDAGVQVMTTLVRDSVTTVFLLGLMLYRDWQLTLLCLILIPGVALSIRIVGRRQRRISRETQSSMGDMTRILDESLSGQRMVKIFGGFRFELTRFLRVNNSVRTLTVKRAATSSMNSGVIMLLIGITLAFIVYYASLRAQQGQLTAGAFVSFMVAMMMIQSPIKNITRINESLHRGLAAAETVFGVLDETEELDDGTQEIGRAKGALKLDDVSFDYGGNNRPALDHVSLDIAPGQTVALVGSSGSGKTTLANLLPRFYEATSGGITLDGVPVNQFRIHDLRRQFAMVSQDVILFNDTVAANIAYGDAAPDLERIRAAATAAFALDFIEAMPEGFNTMLGENGVRLSGGQRQRLAIARAIYKDAPVLILDEATSALDTESERKVQAALENLMQDRTTIVIAHRLSTIENADRIVVMSQGRIVEAGRHAELMDKGGAYAQMHRVQFTQQVEETAP